MHVDHIIALGRGGKDTLDNMLPACLSCNCCKDTLTIDDFRKYVERFHDALMRDSTTYENAVRFGIVKPNPHKVKFYFEKLADTKGVNKMTWTLDNCSLVVTYGRPEQYDGKCEGYIKARTDNEPIELCKKCALHYLYDDGGRNENRRSLYLIAGAKKPRLIRTGLEENFIV